MKFPIRYNSQSMTLTLQWGKHYKFLQCPFRTWWKARKYFKKPKFKFYFGPMWKYKGRVKTKFGEYTFYVDFDGHCKEEKIHNALEEIQAKAKFYRFVGSYEKHHMAV